MTSGKDASKFTSLPPPPPGGTFLAKKKRKAKDPPPASATLAAFGIVKSNGSGGSGVKAAAATAALALPAAKQSSLQSVFRAKPTTNNAAAMQKSETKVQSVVMGCSGGSGSIDGSSIGIPVAKQGTVRATSMLAKGRVSSMVTNPSMDTTKPQQQTNLSKWFSGKSKSSGKSSGNPVETKPKGASTVVMDSSGASSESTVAIKKHQAAKTEEPPPSLPASLSLSQPSSQQPPSDPPSQQQPPQPPPPPKRRSLGRKRRNKTTDEQHVDESQQMWTSVFCPRNASDLIGNHKAFSSLKTFLKDTMAEKRSRGVKRELKPMAMVWGPTGNGKTSGVKAIAASMGFRVVELVLPDGKLSLNVQLKVRATMRSSDEEGPPSLLMIDDIDSLVGLPQEASGGGGGGGSFLTNLMTEIRESREMRSKQKLRPVPVVCICNDRFSRAAVELGRECYDVRTFPLSVTDMWRVLARVCVKRGISLTKDTASLIVTSASGDARSLINILQYHVIDVEEVQQRQQRPPKRASHEDWDNVRDDAPLWQQIIAEQMLWETASEEKRASTEDTATRMAEMTLDQHLDYRQKEAKLSMQMMVCAKDAARKRKRGARLNDNALIEQADQEEQRESERIMKNARERAHREHKNEVLANQRRIILDEVTEEEMTDALAKARTRLIREKRWFIGEQHAHRQQQQKQQSSAMGKIDIRLGTFDALDSMVEAAKHNSVCEKGQWRNVASESTRTSADTIYANYPMLVSWNHATNMGMLGKEKQAKESKQCDILADVADALSCSDLIKKDAWKVPELNLPGDACLDLGVQTIFKTNEWNPKDVPTGEKRPDYQRWKGWETFRAEQRIRTALNGVGTRIPSDAFGLLPDPENPDDGGESKSTMFAMTPTGVDLVDTAHAVEEINRARRRRTMQLLKESGAAVDDDEWSDDEDDEDEDVAENPSIDTTATMEEDASQSFNKSAAANSSSSKSNANGTGTLPHMRQIMEFCNTIVQHRANSKQVRWQSGGGGRSKRRKTKAPKS